MLNEGDILTVGEVSKLLKVGRATVYRLRSEGILPARFKFFDGERGWRWSREDVEAFIASRTVATLIDRIPKPFIPVSLATVASSSVYS